MASLPVHDVEGAALVHEDGVDAAPELGVLDRQGERHLDHPRRANLGWLGSLVQGVLCSPPAVLARIKCPPELLPGCAPASPFCRPASLGWLALHPTLYIGVD